MSKHIHIHAIEDRVAGPDEPNVVFYETENSRLRLPQDIPPCECGWTEAGTIVNASEYAKTRPVANPLYSFVPQDREQ